MNFLFINIFKNGIEISINANLRYQIDKINAELCREYKVLDTLPKLSDFDGLDYSFLGQIKEKI
jgi:hypothetical protein